MRPWARSTAIAVLSLGVSAGGAMAGDSPAPTAGPPAASAQPAPAAAATEPAPSLMFAPDEVRAIDKALYDRDHPAVAPSSGQAKADELRRDEERAEAVRRRIPNIYVSAVVDFGQGDWIVWANGLRVTPAHQPPLFHVVSVSGSTVEIVPTAEPTTRVRLQPFQTWRSRQGDVVEGIVP